MSDLTDPTSRIQLENYLVLIRVITGIIIAYYGLRTFDKGHMEGNIAWLTDIHFPFPALMAYLGKITELVGSILLILGLFTRIVCMLLIITMSVITFIMGNGKILSNDQFPFLLQLLFGVFLFYGGGKWSLNRVFFK